MDEGKVCAQRFEMTTSPKSRGGPRVHEKSFARFSLNVLLRTDIRLLLEDLIPLGHGMRRHILSCNTLWSRAIIGHCRLK